MMKITALIFSLMALSVLVDFTNSPASKENPARIADEDRSVFLPLVAKSHTIEGIALMALYNNTNGPSWKNNAGWGIGDPCVQDRYWYGVSRCDSGHVQRLFLANNQLSGAIPAELGNLSRLILLNLGDNQLSGSIPAELGNLSSLDGLYLEDNQLSGLIPAELGNLSRLVNLQLGSNQLSGAIPAELSNLSSLIRFNLTDNPDLKCWETEEALNWALSLVSCGQFGCSGSYSGPTEVCQP